MQANENRDMSPIPSVGRSVCLCVQKVYCGKMAHWIGMPFGMVSGVGRGMGVLNGVVIVEGSFVVNLGRPIVTYGTLLYSCVRVTCSSQITLGRTCY